MQLKRMYEVREGRITTDFLPKIKFYKNTTCSRENKKTRENLKFELSAPGAYSRIYGILLGTQDDQYDMHSAVSFWLTEVQLDYCTQCNFV